VVGYWQLRDAGPAVWLPEYEVFALTRHDSVRRALQDWESFPFHNGVMMNDRMNLTWWTRDGRISLNSITSLSVAGAAAAATIFLSATMLSATITAAAAITTAGSESGQRWRSMTARVRLRWLTPLLTAARGCGSGGNSSGSGPAILGIGVGDREGNELCVPTSGDPARAERSRVDGGSERERWAA
jgi:hypothetical protein